MKKRRKKNTSYTSFCLSYLRKRGAICAMLEHRVMCRGFSITRDVFGADLIAIWTNMTLLVQAGSDGHHRHKCDYALTHPDVRAWLSCPTRLFQVWTWKKRPAFCKGGQRKKRDEWTPRVSAISIKDGKLVATPFVLTQ